MHSNNCSLLKIFRTASGIVLFERGAIGFSSLIAFQNTLNHQNQTITSGITLFLVIATICARFVISVFFSSVIDHDPPTQIRRYYGMILTFDNYRRPLNVLKKPDLEKTSFRNFGIWTTPADQTRLALARTTVSTYHGNFTAKFLITWLLWSVVNCVLNDTHRSAHQFSLSRTVYDCMRTCVGVQPAMHDECMDS